MGHLLARLAATDPSLYNDVRLVLHGPWGRVGTALGLLCALAALALSIYGYRRERPARRIGLCLLRGLAIGAALILFFQPAIELRMVEKLPNHVAILVDGSASMSVAETAGKETRAARAAEWLARQSGALAELRKQRRVDFYSFAGALSPQAEADLATGSPQPRGEATKLREALTALRQRYAGRDLGGVIVVSDGIDNGRLADARSPQGPLDGETREFLHNLGAPVHTVWVGRPGLHDVAVSAVLADDFAFVRTAVKVEAVVRAHGYRGQDIPIVLKRDGEVVRTRTLTLDSDAGEWRIPFEFTPDRVGKYVYEISTPVLPGEALAQNNARAFVLKVIRDKIRVLQVCGRPSWDERFLRAMLKRDPNVDLISFFILRTPTNLQWARNEELSLIQFPTRELFEEELKSFDVVILQNFNYAPYGVAPYLPRIREYVESGGGLAMIGGDLAFSSGGYARSPLADILPVELPDEELRPERLLSTEEFRPRLTASGRVHPVTSLVLGAHDNAERWNALPPLEGLNLVLRARPQAQVLLEHPFLKGEGGQPMPALAVGDAGKGRSLALLTDSAWRWGFWAAHAGGPNSDGRAFQKFWENAIRWLIQDPSQRLLQVHTDAAEYLPSARPRIDVRLLGADYQPQRRAALSLVVVDAEGHAAWQRSGQSDDDGELRSELAPLAPGPYRVIARAQAGGRPIEESEVFLVRADGKELEDVEARPELLQAIAHATSGRFDDGSGSIAGLTLVDSESVRVGRHKDVEVWSFGWVFFLAIVLLSAEWALRRRFGYV
jgi:uncharacterized membrane protein